ncbi:MAG: SDR family oxidoreductase [Saprospiraceae bacterium]|nr:SDR family oxidoreductase [Saprospiraceae bacterium]
MIKIVSILGCGWLGLPLAQTLLVKGYQVKGSTTTPEKLSQLQAAGITPFLLEVGDEVTGKQIDDFFDTELLIINIPPKRNQPNIETLYPAQINAILKKALQHGVQAIIFVSSTGVYGDTNEVVTENTPVQPDRANTRGLVQAELLVQACGLNWSILRMAGLVGGTRKAGRFFAGKTDLPEADAPVNLVHLDDCIGVVCRLLEQPCWGEIFNVCATAHPTKKDFYSSQTLKEGLKVPDFLIPTTPSPFKIVSNEKVKRMLSYTFSKPDPMFF